MGRGYAAIALDNPKTPENVGGVLRAAFCYGAAQVTLSNIRSKAIDHCTNTPKADRHVPVFLVSDPLEYRPHNCPVVAVDLVDDAVPLPEFQHPERALYVFGAEDQTLGARILSRSQHRVYVPTRSCMNLAACVNVVLYDRLVKRGGFNPAYGAAA